jgi:hypothetical protein
MLCRRKSFSSVNLTPNYEEVSWATHFTGLFFWFRKFWDLKRLDWMYQLVRIVGLENLSLSSTWIKALKWSILKALFDVKHSAVLYVLANSTCTPSNTTSMKHLAHWCYEMNCIAWRSSTNKGLFFDGVQVLLVIANIVSRESLFIKRQRF